MVLVKMVENDECATACCYVCGQVFPVGNVVGTACGTETQRPRDRGDHREDAYATGGWLGLVCPECGTSNAETIRARAVRRALDLTQQVADQVRLVEAIRTTVFDLPMLSCAAYHEMAFPMAYPPELRDDEDHAAGKPVIPRRASSSVEDAVWSGTTNNVM